jgi:outer membrane protein OmpA-like peptidoglycan-associated protein
MHFEVGKGCLPDVVTPTAPVAAPVGSIVGIVKDASGNAVPRVQVTLIGANGKERSTIPGGHGLFTFDAVSPGEVALRIEAPDYMVGAAVADVRASEQAEAAIVIAARPKVAGVKREGARITLPRPIRFETDKPTILVDSSVVLAEVADVLQRHPDIRKVEIQFHSDGAGAPQRNQDLSDARARAVRRWLIAAGVDGERLTARGYVPRGHHHGAVNKQKRRIELIILE